MKKNPTILALISVVIIYPFIAHAAFVDVSNTHVNAEAIAYVQSQGIVGGYPDGTFGASRNINRAEFTKIVIEATSTDISGSQCFPDVSDQWFAKYVCTAKNLGVIGGYPDGTFRPEKEVSFVEASKIIAVAFDTELNVETDIWYEGYVRSLAGINAIPTSVHSFDAKITRGEMAEMIYRLHAKHEDLPSVTYEQLAGLAPIQQPVRQMGYPFNFPLTPDWIDRWNFYIDEYPVHMEPEEGVNFLTKLDLERVERLEGQEGIFHSFLRVLFPKGAGSNFISHFYDKDRAGVVAVALGQMKPTEEIHMRYYVRFPTDFDFSTEGTLPVIRGATESSEYGAWGSTFYAGIGWTNKGELVIRGSFQDDLSINRKQKQKFLADGEWHKIDISARLNTVPIRRMNGSLTVKYDGEQVYKSDTISFRGRAEDKWDSIGLYATIGTMDTFSVAKKDMNVDLAGFTVSDKPIN